ncbi:MAG: leucyl aminopeptidase, partial [Lachnospiraceae bacterium]
MENQMENLRFGLALNRIREITQETGAVSGIYQNYFQDTAQEIANFVDTAAYFSSKEAEDADLSVLAQKNRLLYADILPDHYGSSWCCPDYAKDNLGEELGPILCALAFEMRSMIPFLFEGEDDHALIRMEVFLEVYRCFENAKKDADDLLERGDKEGAEAAASPKARFVRGILAGYLADYAQDELTYDLNARLVDGSPSLNRMIAEADLSNPGYLYRSGLYIGPNETGTAKHLAELSKEKVQKMADTFTEGYRIGFVTTGKDLSKKKTVDLVYTAGFERMMRKASENFAALGKTCIAHRELSSMFLQMGRTNGVTGGAANRQADYDHREDLALFLDDTLANRMTESLALAFRAVAERAKDYAGPAVVEPYGEAPFAPKESGARSTFDKVQNRMVTRYRQKFTDLYNEAVIGENRSFTIISFPLPEIAEDETTYGEIFDETIRLNTLDYHL